MATCKECLHYDICIFHTKGNENEKCPHFKITADAVHVVRCKECKHCDKYTKWDGKEYHGCNINVGIGIFEVEPSHFCSYGRRKDEISKATDS